MNEVKPLEEVDPEFASLLMQVVGGSLMAIVENTKVFEAIGWGYKKNRLIRKPVREIVLDIGRNDPCVCGSGNKFKKCCGKELTK